MRTIEQLLLIILLHLSLFCAFAEEKDDCTDLARDEETLLVFSTLGGGLTAIDPLSSEIRWTIDDEPAVKAASQAKYPVRQYLPDPRDGSLYQLGNLGDLKKLPYTIPQLVANAPCRSSDGILYSGKKSDTWFLIDPKTGRRQKVMGFGQQMDGFESIGWATSRSVYLGRTQYTVMMYDSVAKDKNSKPWNITFYDYASHTMAPEVSSDYDYIHLAGSSTGLTVTLDRKRGKLFWQKDLSSPVIAVFLLGPDGLLSVPFTTVAEDALHNIIEEAKEGNGNGVKLFKSLYIGEHTYGLYALPSLVGKDTATISTDLPIKMIEGPQKGRENIPQYLVYLYDILDEHRNAIVLGHYQVPKNDESLKLKISPTKSKITGNNQLATIVNTGSLRTNDFIIINEQEKSSVGVQTDDETITVMKEKNTSNDFNDNANLLDKETLTKYLFDFKDWISEYQTPAILIIVSAMFWYTITIAREIRQHSQNSSQTMNRSSGSSDISCNDLEELGNGVVKVGKITFNCNEVLGKGCEGTFVFKGTFEERSVAVKRLLPGCFTFADREVALLRESDAHENVVRYFCTEQDRQFRYIAVELCAATLQDYTEGERAEEFQNQINALEVLRQSVSGLSHLHSLNIVHRDIKPQNVLLSWPDINNRVKIMISDFGLCKKLSFGKASFSRRSGITGTEGWIAPEMMQGERTTTSVDIFSLGCVFYYVLTKGKHPFGEPLRRQANILSDEANLTDLCADNCTSQNILAEQLVGDMIQYNAQNRPTAQAICSHPLFWGPEKIQAFLQDVSDRVEKLNYEVEPLRTLEKNGKFVVRDDWTVFLDDAIANDLKKYRGYLGHSVRDLLRAFRNKKHHYHELHPDVQSILGQIPDEYNLYWIKKFPHLVSHAYHALSDFSDESPFRCYYDPQYKFSRPDYFTWSDPSRSNFLNRMKNNNNSPKDNGEKVQKNNRRGFYNFHKVKNDTENNGNPQKFKFRSTKVKADNNKQENNVTWILQGNNEPNA